MDRKRLASCISHAEEVAHVLHRLSRDAATPEIAAYWQSIGKAHDAAMVALESLHEHAPARQPVDPDSVAYQEVSDILSALIDAADTLASQYPFLLVEQIPIEVDPPAYARRRSTRRVGSSRVTAYRSDVVGRELEEIERLA